MEGAFSFVWEEWFHDYGKSAKAGYPFRVDRRRELRPAATAIA
jgi:hypothetical protein